MKKLISTTLMIALLSALAFCQTENKKAQGSVRKKVWGHLLKLI